MRGLEVFTAVKVVDEVGKIVVRLGELGVGREPLVEP